MEKLDESKIRLIMMEIISLERKNLRTKTKNDTKMVEELSKVIIGYSRQRY